MNFNILLKKEKNFLPAGSWVILGQDEKEKFLAVLKLVSQFISPADIFIIAHSEDIPEEYKEKFSVLPLSIEVVRLAVKFLNFTARDGRKVLIVNKMELASAEVQNTLLKTAEEPSAEATLFFLAKEEESLLPTLLSRARKLNFISDKKKYFEERISEEEVASFNQSGRGDFLKSALLLSDDEKARIAENLAIMTRDQILDLVGLEKLKITKVKNLSNANFLTEKNDKRKMLDHIFKYLPRLKNLSSNHRLQLESLFFRLWS